MKKWLLKMLKPFIKRKIKKLLGDEQYQKKLVYKINKKVNIPKIDEKAEEKVLNQIYDVLQELALDIVEKV